MSKYKPSDRFTCFISAPGSYAVIQLELTRKNYTDIISNHAITDGIRQCLEACDREKAISTAMRANDWNIQVSQK